MVGSILVLAGFCFLVSYWVRPTPQHSLSMNKPAEATHDDGSVSGPTPPQSALSPHPPPTSREASNSYTKPVVSVEWFVKSPPSPARPSGGTGFALITWPEWLGSEGGGLAEFSGPGSEIGWPSAVTLIDECRLTNYSTETLFNVRIMLHVSFYKVVEDADHPGATRSGDVSLSRDWPISLRKLDIGPDHSFTFYIVNPSDKFVSVSFPESATAQLASDKGSRVIKLMRPEGSMFPLAPVRAVKLVSIK